MALDRLAALIGPPSGEPFPVPWAALQAHLGIRFPADYRELVEAYGPVRFGEWFSVLTPTGDGYFGSLRQHHGLGRIHRDADPEAHPYAFAPEAGGLFAWGYTARTDTFFWDTSASPDPDRWPTRVRCHDSGSGMVWRTFSGTTTEILETFLHGELDLHPAESRRLPSTTWVRVDEPPLDPADIPAEPPPPLPRPLGLHAERPVPGRWEDAPPDYRALLGEVGPGTVAGALRLLAPGAPDGFDADAEQRRVADRLAGRRAAGLRTVSMPIAPRISGARIWGVLETGETFWWLSAHRDPARWPILVLDADGVGWQTLALSTTDLLDRWLGGRIDLPTLSSAPARRARQHQPPGAPVSAAASTAHARPRDTLEQLITLIGPGPSTPRGPWEWDAIAADLGVDRLPSDYRRLCAEYGATCANGLFVPAPDELAEQHRIYASPLRDWFREYPEEALPVRPDPDGLLFFAGTEGRDLIWWETTDPDPDRWTMIWDVEFDRHRFAGTATELLIADQTGRLDHALTGRHPFDGGPFDG